MDELNELKPTLKRLRMSGVLEDLDESVKEAMDQKWSYSQLLMHLFTREAERRDHKKYCYRLSRSKLDARKTFENFEAYSGQSIHPFRCKVSTLQFLLQPDYIII